MRDTFQRLLKLAAGYSLVTLIGPLFTIVLTPLYTRVLTLDDYGIVSVCLTLSGLLGVIVLLSMDQAIALHFFDGDEQHKRTVVTTAVVYVGAAGLATGCIVFALAEPLALLLFKDPTRRITLQLLAMLVVCAPLYAVLTAALRLRMGVRRVNALGLAYLLSYVGLNVLFVLILRLKVTGIIAANVLANVTGVGVGLALFWRPLRGTFELRCLQPLLRGGLGLVPGVIGYVMLANIDRLLLTQYVDKSLIGLYDIANRLSSMLYVGFSALWSAWWPMALEMTHRPDAPRQYARIFEYFAAASMLAALALGLFAPEILRVFTRQPYVAAAPLAMVLMIYSGPLAFMNGSFQIGLFVRKRTRWISIASLISAGLNIVLNVILDPYLGVWGATWATVAAGLVFSAIVYAAGQHALFVDYRWLRTLALGACYLSLLGIFGGLLGPLSAGSRALAVALFASAIFAVGFVRWSQFATGIHMVTRWLAAREVAR